MPGSHNLAATKLSYSEMGSRVVRNTDTGAFEPHRCLQLQIQEIDSAWVTSKVEAASSSEPLLTLYQSTPRYIP
jgi:hypothetical protein